MVGIDIVDVARFETALSTFGERMLKRLFTESEIIYCASMRRPAAHFAARYAAKECVVKILGRECAWRFKNIEIVASREGKPRIELHGITRDAGGGLYFEVSMSHDGDTAAAVVIAEKT